MSGHLRPSPGFLPPLVDGHDLTAMGALQGTGAGAQHSSETTGSADAAGAQVNLGPCGHCGASDHKGSCTERKEKCKLL